jgi:hypothetical protein
MVFLVNGENHLFVEGGFFFWRIAGLQDYRIGGLEGWPRTVLQIDVFSPNSRRRMHTILTESLFAVIPLRALREKKDSAIHGFQIH